MANEIAALTPPSQNAFNTVLRAAYNSPTPNLDVAQQNLAAIREVDAFFRQVYPPPAQPQINSQTGAAGSIPQAPASAEGKPVSQA